MTIRIHPRARLAALISSALVFASPAYALMAGSAPDSPAARVDANSATSPFAGVSSISIGGNTFSGVLIAPGYLLTAAHVASGVAVGDITVNVNAGGNLAYQVGASAVYVNPGYTGFVGGKAAEGDLAIIKLADALPGSVPTYGLYRNPLATGTTLTLVGYGASGNGDGSVTIAADPAVKRVGENNADYIAPNTAGTLAQALYYFDFDGPTLATNGIGANTPSNATLGNSLETSVAAGDSGSPAFVKDAGGNWLLAGINTFHLGTGYGFGSGGGGQVLAGYASWIDSVTSPVPEPMESQSMLFGAGLIAGVSLLRRRR